MGKKKAHAEHENAERWLLTYADLITLLLGLFVILYASSQLDAKKYQEISAAFNKFFTGGAGILPGNIGALSAPVAPPKTVATAPIPRTDDLQSELESSLAQALGAGYATLSSSDRGVTVHVNDKLLFNAGQSEIRPEALPTLKQLASTLESIPNDIRVEGHTDNTPIATSQYPTNWHLSVARALNVGYFLMANSAVDPKKFSIVGYGEFKPLGANDSEEGRALNRRVDVVIVK